MDPLNSPAIPPPAGTQSNIDNPASRTILTIVPSAAVVGVMIVAVFTRCYTKVYVVKSTGWDDCKSLNWNQHGTINDAYKNRYMHFCRRMDC